MKLISRVGLLSILLVLSCSTIALSQDNTVSGVVRDASSGDSLPGVNILVKGTTSGTSTDANGNYQLEVPSLQDTLVFTFIGYQKREVPINGRNTIDITLKQQAISGEELVVVGYGTQKKEEVISGISTVSTEQLGLDDQPTTSVSDLLKGRVSGVNIRESTGASGSTPEIRVRGISSINAGVRPLIVVDGYPVGNSFPQSLNPDNIKDITVLKDAASTSIYGARGSNGVVLIETKNAKAGQSEFSYNGYIGVQQVPESWRPSMLDAIEYAKYNKERREALYEFNNVPNKPTPKVFLDVLNNPEQWKGGGTDWLGEFLREGTEALSQKHNLTYKGGNEKISTVISGGFLKRNGVVPDDDFQRLSLRGKVNATLSDNINMDVNISGARTVNNRVNADGLRGPLWSAITTSPLQSPYDEDGKLKKFIPADTAGYFTKPNPIFQAKANQNEQQERDLQANVGFDIKLIKGLQYRPRFSGRQFTQETNFFKPTTVGNVSIAGPNDLDRGAPPQINNANFTTLSVTNWNINNLLIYGTNFSGNHNLKITLGHTIQKEKGSSHQIQGANFPSDNNINFNQAGDLNAASGGYEWALLAEFGRINYNYKGKYLAEANFRREGSSRLGANQRYGNFPSGAIGWRISQENFYPQNFLINNFLIRASIGKTGNNAIGNFESLGRLGSIRYVLGDAIREGKHLTSFSNKDLRWETAVQYQVGVTLGLLNNLMNVKVDYYKKTTKNMLFDVPLPRASGFRSTRINIGEMENKGLDLSISASSGKSNIQWSSNLNVSFMSNKVTKMPEQVDEIITGGRGGLNVTKEGEPVGALHGLIRLGLFDEETINDPNLYGWRGAKKILGTNIFKDINGDGFLNFDDMTVIGDPHPDVTFGFSNQFSYQNISLSFLLTGMLGYEVMQQYHDVDLNTVARYNVSTLELNRWRSPENPGNGFAPRSEVNDGARQWMDDWLSPGGHLWIKNIKISYNLPVNISQSIGVKDLRFYVNISNVARIDNYVGFNPEASSTDNPLSSGLDDYIYPLTREFTIGANFTF